jgi:hypothetical protein
MTPSRAALARSDAKPTSGRPVRLMQRIYRDVGLSAVARELDLSTPDLEIEVGEAVKRGARYVYLAPKADRESQALPPQPASAVSTDREPPDARVAAVSASPPEPASVESAAGDVGTALKTDRESTRNDISGPPLALPRAAPAVSLARESPDACPAAVPASLLGPEPVKPRAPYVYLAPKADYESTGNDAATLSQALRRQLHSVISVDRGLPDTRVAEVHASPLEPVSVKQAARHVNLAPQAGRDSERDDASVPPRALPRQPASVVSKDRTPLDASAVAPASLLQPEPTKRREPYVSVAPKADGESIRNGASGPSHALPRQPALAVSPARGSSDASAAAAVRHANLAPEAARESDHNDTSDPSQARPRLPASAFSPTRGSPDSSTAAVPAPLLEIEPVKRSADYVYLAPKADGESKRNDISVPLQALPRQPVSVISPARVSSDASAVEVAGRLNSARNADSESTRNDISSPSQTPLPQPAWGLLLRRQPSSATSPARGLPDASVDVVVRHVNLAPEADRESWREDISDPSPALLRRPASAISPASGSSNASALAAAPHVDLAPKTDSESRGKDISSPPQALLRQPASGVSPAWGLLLRREPRSAIFPARGLPDARAPSVAASLLGPSFTGGRPRPLPTKIIRGDAGPILRTGGEGRVKALKPPVEVPPDRFKRLDKSFWPLLPKN